MAGMPRPAEDHPNWPLFDIRLTTPNVQLRPLTEADLPALAAILPEDYEQDPAATTFAGLSAAENRSVIVHQEYWKAYGLWRPDRWALICGVWQGEELIGQQVLEGADFQKLRTVDSASFLIAGARGRGLGKHMRAAVLALAFGPLGADFAITSAWTDNQASLGVSRSLGYADNGVSVLPRGGGVGTLTHLRLAREAWLRSEWPDRVTVAGVQPCLPFFGL